MTKFLSFTVFIFAFSLAASATPSWAAIYTGQSAADTRTEGTEASIQGYSGYLCSYATAQDLFGATSASDIESYLKNNFSSVTWEGAKAFASSGYEDSQYAIKLADGTSYSSTEFIAVALYGSTDAAESFRVFGAGSAALAGDSLVFDDGGVMTATATVGAWTAVPEPTRGLLLLVGMAGLALRRRRGVLAASE